MGLLDDIGAGLAAAQTPGLVDDNGNPTISGDLTAQNTPGLTDGQGAAGVQGLPGSPSGPAPTVPSDWNLNDYLPGGGQGAAQSRAIGAPASVSVPPPPVAPPTVQPPPVSPPTVTNGPTPGEMQGAAAGQQAARLALAQKLSAGAAPQAQSAPQGQPTQAPPIGPDQSVAVKPVPATSTDANAPRGIRNNNPLNLQYVPGQPGLDPNNPTDGRFGRYLTAQQGVASAVTQLQRYSDQGITTVAGIISKWSPASENGAANTNAYINQVSSALGVKPTDPINVHDPAVVTKLVSAMGQHENGQPIDPMAVQGGVKIAFGQSAPGTQFAGPGAPTSGSNSAPPGTPLVANGNTTQGFNPFDFMSSPEYAKLASLMRPTSSQQLMALASGLLGARTWGQGLGQGLANMNQMQLQGRQMEGELAKIGLSSAQIAAMMGYRNTRLGQMQTTLDMGKPVGQPIQLSDGSMAQPYNTPNGTIYKPLPGVTTQQQRVTNQVSGGNAFGGIMGKEAGGDYKKLMEGAQTDALSTENITSAITELKRNPGMYGPTAKAQTERYLAMIGLGDPGPLQAFQKASADQQAKYLENATGGHVAALRALGSLQMFAKAVAHADTQPDAAQYVFDSQLAMINARNALRAEVNKDPSAWQGPQFSTKEQQFYTNYFNQPGHKLPIYKPGYTSSIGGGSAQPQGGGSPSMDTANSSTTHTVTLGGQNYQVTYNPPSQ